MGEEFRLVNPLTDLNQEELEEARKAYAKELKEKKLNGHWQKLLPDEPAYQRFMAVIREKDRRESKKRERRMVNLTNYIFWLTVAIGVLTLINLVVVFYGK